MILPIRPTGFERSHRSCPSGEQGRGRAVVADEVRKLAERATTQKIVQMIQTVQQEAKLAVGAMEQGTQQVEEGVQTTNKAGKP